MQLERFIASTSAGSLKRPRRSGFTLAEALIASVFLAVAALGVAGTLAAASKSSEHLSESANCQGLARELIEEASSRSFTTQPNPGFKAAVTNRANYDDVADYDGYTDNTTSGIKTLSGTTVTLGDGATYTRTVAFEYRSIPGGSKKSSGDFGMLTVTVSTNHGTSVTLQKMLSNSVLKR